MKTTAIHRHRPRLNYSGPARERSGDNERPLFFNSESRGPFFRSARAFGYGELKGTDCVDCGEEERESSRKDIGRVETAVNRLQNGPAPIEDERKEKEMPVHTQGGEQAHSTRHFANCENVQVQGQTDANYSDSYSSDGSRTPAADCEGCADDCIQSSGTVVSVFEANPVITLPSVPSGLNACEQQAVRQFIDTTLLNHERQHVRAFKTYNGTVRTPYNYHGCASGLDDHIRDIHTTIEAARRQRSDDASAQLDANGANIFNVTCDCPDPEPDEKNKSDKT